MNVLIVEDSRFLRVSNERALQHAGYDVITAADGEGGLRLALERKPDLVVLDLMLPKLPGYEVLRELRKHRETAKIPVMIVSSCLNRTIRNYSTRALRPTLRRRA